MENFRTNSFIFGVMTGVLLAGAWFLGSDTPFLNHRADTPPNTRDLALPESGAIQVRSQNAGDTVVVESVTVPPQGIWVAVRELSGTDLGNVLGAAWVVDATGPITVSLLRATEPGRTYAVVLYRDDGDKIFSMDTDSVYVDFQTGLPALTRFTTN